ADQQELVQTMFAIRGALGVRCDFCHNQQDLASDEKPEKLMARKMIEMVNNINANTFNGEQKVACWTCHRGQQKPEAPPPVQMPGRGPGGGGPGGRGPGGGGPGGGPGGPPPAQ
ncbi:MAG TPA: c-type cytochrome, partial [Bryobacteraceae bacterium]|nr:c-type cytochrome [Bryobacteraceae bacterium]